jgi:antitoxin MazE
MYLLPTPLTLSLTSEQSVATVITKSSCCTLRSMAMEKQSRTRDIKLISIGNSKGVRLPKTLLQKYGFNNSLLLEETDRGLLLRNKEDDKISWEDTFRAMASEKEDWDDFDTALLDGLEDEAIEY